MKFAYVKYLKPNGRVRNYTQNKATLTAVPTSPTVSPTRKPTRVGDTFPPTLQTTSAPTSQPTALSTRLPTTKGAFTKALSSYSALDKRNVTAVAMFLTAHPNFMVCEHDHIPVENVLCERQRGFMITILLPGPGATR